MVENNNNSPDNSGVGSWITYKLLCTRSKIYEHALFISGISEIIDQGEKSGKVKWLLDSHTLKGFGQLQPAWEPQYSHAHTAAAAGSPAGH